MKLSRTAIATIGLVVGAVLCFAPNQDAQTIGRTLAVIGGLGLLVAFFFGDIED